MKHLHIGKINVSTNDSGLFSLNDIHKASGGAVKNMPSKWLRSKGAKDLIAHYSGRCPDLDIVHYPLQFIIETKKGGRTDQGTFASRELVIAYANWISPSFYAQVIGTFLETRDKALAKKLGRQVNDDLMASQIGLFAQELNDMSQRQPNGEETLPVIMKTKTRVARPLYDRLIDLGYIECKETTTSRRIFKPTIKGMESGVTTGVRGVTVLFNSEKVKAVLAA